MTNTYRFANPILLLDEATSALDEQTEKQLLQSIRSLTDKTVVIVPHRPAALSICDRVLQFTEAGVMQVDSFMRAIDMFSEDFMAEGRAEEESQERDGL